MELAGHQEVDQNTHHIIAGRDEHADRRGEIDAHEIQRQPHRVFDIENERSGKEKMSTARMLPTIAPLSSAPRNSRLKRKIKWSPGQLDHIARARTETTEACWPAFLAIDITTGIKTARIAAFSKSSSKEPIIRAAMVAPTKPAKSYGKRLRITRGTESVGHAPPFTPPSLTTSSAMTRASLLVVI